LDCLLLSFELSARLEAAMCKEQVGVSVGPRWEIERSNTLWKVKVAVTKAPEVDISASTVRLDGVSLPIPEHALPLDPDVARCTFSKRRGELLVEWPCRADEGVQTTAEATAEAASEPDVQDTPVEVAEAVAEAVATEVEAVAEAVSVPDLQHMPAETHASSLNEDVATHTTEEQHEPETAVTAEEWKSRGNDALKVGDLDAAVECYSSGISEAARGGGNTEAEALLRSNRALCFHKLGRYQEAVDDASRCVALKPAFVKGFLRGAMALRALGRPAEAHALLKRAPVNAECCALAAEIRPEAEAAEKSRIEALPKAERIKEEGNVLFRKGLFEPAAEKYSEALGLCEEPMGALALSIRNNRAACNHQISDFSAVIKDTNFVLEQEPRNFKALMRRMLALEPLERYEQALQDARGVLAQDPRNEVANKVQHRLGKLVRDLSRANGGA